MRRAALHPEKSNRLKYNLASIQEYADTDRPRFEFSWWNALAVDHVAAALRVDEIDAWDP
ncbi:MAG: hypothetical protein R6U98_03340 [Pirellulaceae bacterium]